MIEPALRYFVQLAQESARPVKLDVEDPRNDHYLRGDSLITVPIPKEPRAHKVNSLNDLITLANRFGVPAVVWYDELAVVLVIDDDGHRCETAMLKLVKSDVFRTVYELREDPRWMNQKEFCRFLRLELASAIEAGALLNIAKDVRFEAGTVIAGKIDRTKESLGREINQAVSAREKDIPERVGLEMSIYVTPGLDVGVTVIADVDVDPGAGMFRLIPFPDEIARVQQATMQHLARELTDGLNKAIPCYYGTP
jgi:hypothetical protein